MEELKRSLNEILASIHAPVTVTASEVVPSFSITTMLGKMSRSSEGYAAVSELEHGVTTPRVTPSKLAVPSSLALVYGYANMS